MTPGGALSGTCRVPGDKSISQRALILAALAEGPSRLRGLLPSADPRSTAAALRALGVAIPALPDDGSEIVVQGKGLRGLRPSSAPLDLGNSGTGARLLLGILAAQPFATVVDGDALSHSIAAASIIAKTTRDRLMQSLHNTHPQYHWITNVGYPTRDHYEALRLHGATPLHRRSFRLGLQLS